VRRRRAAPPPSTGETDAVFAALAHPHRRLVLQVLLFRGGSLKAGEIADRFSCAWPTTTRHLRVLLDARLVRVRRRGRERIYSVDARRIVRVAGGWAAWFGLPRGRRRRVPS
jgi:DNA-binding transcriptional ArsR family regulator